MTSARLFENQRSITLADWPIYLPYFGSCSTGSSAISRRSPGELLPDTPEMFSGASCVHHEPLPVIDLVSGRLAFWHIACRPEEAESLSGKYFGQYNTKQAPSFGIVLFFLRMFTSLFRIIITTSHSSPPRNLRRIWLTRSCCP